MRVLLTTDTMGGVWSFTSTLARGLLDAGHSVALVSFGPKPSCDQAATMVAFRTAFPGRFSFCASDAPLEWMTPNDHAWKAGSSVLSRVMSEFAPDILHTSQMCFGRMNDVLPVLVTAHSDVLSWAESTLRPEGLTRLEHTASPAWLRTYRTLVERGLREAAMVVAPTRWMAETTARLFNLECVPEVIANGILPRAASARPRRLQAITAGRLWDEAKGLDILSELEPPMPFLVAGRGKRGALDPNPGFIWLEPRPHADLLSLFSESAVYVATSVYEPFGLAPLEAAEQGCAIVARDIPSFREVWKDGASYFTSARSLHHILSSLAGNPRRLRGAQCRARLRARRYSGHAMAEGYLSLYKKLVTTAAMEQESELAHA